MKNRTAHWQELVLLLFTTLLTPVVAAGAEPAAKANATGKPAAKNTVDDRALLAQPWSESLFAHIEKLFGPAAAKRFRYVQDTVLANQSKPVREKLEIANSTLNKLPWASDQQQWNSDDYWATPFELIARAGGDCEDMAIAKFVMLRMMGVPRRNLYLGYAKIRATNEIHMILVWANDKRTDVRVLDNMVKEIKPAKERMDLQVVFLIDADQNMILIDDDGAKRKVKSELGHRKYAKLENLEKHIAEIREKARQYNEGRPLFID